MSNDQVTVSYSELDAYRQCPLKWWFGYQQLWTREQGEGTPLHRGSAWHLILETHYRIIQAERTKADGTFLANPSAAIQTRILTKAWEAVLAAGLLNDPATGAQTEQQELLTWMYQGHIETYGIDPQWRIHGVEIAGRVPLLDLNGNESRYLLKHKIDLVVTDLETGQLKLVDHKSAADFSRPSEIDIDDQFGLYSWAWGRWHDGQRPICVVRSDARTRRNKGPMTLEQRFQRQQTFRSDIELDRIATDAYLAAESAYGTLERVGRVHSAPDPRQCGWKCDFLDAHLALRKVGPRTETATVLSDFGFFQRAAKHQEYTVEEGQS